MRPTILKRFSQNKKREILMQVGEKEAKHLQVVNQYDRHMDAHCDTILRTLLKV